MAADGSVDFAVRLVNQVTGPAKQIQRSFADVRKQAEMTRKALEAPAPRRQGTSDWDRMMAKSRLSQASDNARQQAQIARLNAADAAKAQKLKAAEQSKAAKLAAQEKKKSDLKAKKEATRIADYHLATKQHKLDQQGAFVDSASSMLGTGTAAIAGIALAAAAAVAYLGAKFTAAAVEAAAFGERSRMALGMLTDSAGTGALQFDSLRKEAAGLGLDIERTQMSYQKLLAAQFSIGKSRELIRMGADLQAIGAKADDVEGVLLAITQIKSKGKLQAEEMLQLQERGISAELVYGALGEKMGKSKDQLMALQKKGQLGGPEVIDAILAAVRKKTNTEFAGQAGEKFAQASLTGMLGVWTAKGKNFMIDVGDAILPGLRTLSATFSSGLDALLKDPALSHIGQFLLLRFEYFTLWVEAEWPRISKTLTGGLELFGSAIEFTVDLFDTGTIKGKVFAGVLLTLGVAFGLLALGGFMLMLPLYLLIGVIGLVAYGIYKAVMWISDALSSLPNWATTGLTAASMVMPGGGMIAGGLNAVSSPGVTTAAETGAGATLGRTLGSYSPEIVTVQGEEQGKQLAANTFDFSGMQVGANVDTSDLAAKIRSEVTKALDEHT